MTPFETFKAYKALKLHFTTKHYDIFKYKGQTKVSPSTFERLPAHEQRAFYSISQMSEPRTYLTGNFLFNKSDYIRDFNNDHYLEYRKFLMNGLYIFESEVGYLKSPLVSNFAIEDENDIPYIVQIALEERVSLYTLCVFERLISWTSKVKNPFVQEFIIKVNKSQEFFKINAPAANQMLVQRFKNS